jgi:hypothetical protein
MATTATTTNPSPLTLKVQTWSDDLRLPCLINAAETTGLLNELEPLRQQSLPFQSKHLPALKRNKWFVLRRPDDRTRSGFVVIWPAQQICVYVSGDPVSHKRPTPRVALLRVRIDPQFLASNAGLTVFAATLSGSTRALMIEDTLVWKGRYVFNDDTFTARYAMAVQWIEHYCILDPRLLGGIEITMAAWSPLTSLKPNGVWDIQSDEVGKRRFLWIANHEGTRNQQEYQHPGSMIEHVHDALPAVTAPTLEVGAPLIAVATRESGPEQWGLASSDGVSLGRALIRTLSVSERLRSSKVNTLRVEVVWNVGFNKWEIKGVSDSLASHSGNFEAAK